MEGAICQLWKMRCIADIQMMISSSKYTADDHYPYELEQSMEIVGLSLENSGANTSSTLDLLSAAS